MDLSLDQYRHPAAFALSSLKHQECNNDMDLLDPFDDDDDDDDAQNGESIRRPPPPPPIDTQEQQQQQSFEINEYTVNASSSKVKPEEFKILKTIGKGGYGTVFLVQKLSPPKLNDYFAMKVLKKAKIVRSEKDTAHTVSERNILQMLRHPFLVKLNYAFQSKSYLYIVLEYCPGGELFNYLEKIVHLKEEAASFYVAEITLAIGHLHRLGIIYRDLKSENILLDKDGHVKLTDFGLSKEGVRTTNTFCGTIEYMAPEIIKCLGHGKEVDWWSLGTLLFDMLSGGPPFYQERGKADTAQNILHADVKFPDSFSREVIGLIEGLLTRDPQRRLGSVGDVEEIKEHEFFKKNAINWQDVYDRKMTPPFKPILASATDVSMFDQNFTNMKPTVSPVDAKTCVPPNLFQGFSYVANSVCGGGEPNVLRSADEFSISLRNDRRQLLLNTKLNNNNASRTTTTTTLPPQSTTTMVEAATDCLEMDDMELQTGAGGVNSLLFEFGGRGVSASMEDVDDCPGAQQIPLPNRGLTSRHSGTKALFVATPPMSVVQQPIAAESAAAVAVRKTSLVSAAGSHRTGSSNNCLLM